MRLGIYEGTLLSLVIFTLIAVSIQGKGPTTLIIALLSVATFLFGIFGAFITNSRQIRLNELRVTLSNDDALERLFNELDLLPYYPEYIIKSRRVKLKKRTKIRVAYYPKPYPDITGKRVKIKKI